MAEEEEVSAPGWDAIDEALRRLYGDLEPMHYGTKVKYIMGGPDPLDGISVYAVEEPIPHWHYVTYGLTELYEKESPRAEISGFGFELTLRLAREAGDVEPPLFALNFLQNLARYVYDSGKPFSQGHTMDFNGPIALERKTRITAGCFVSDPDFTPLQTPHGSVELIQVVGITRDELTVARAWQKSSFLEILARRNPKLITDLRRASILDDEAVTMEIRRRIPVEGSSTGTIMASRMSVSCSGFLRRKIRWTLGAPEAISLGMVLPGRLPLGHSLAIQGGDVEVFLEPGDSNVAEMRGGRLRITLNRDGAKALAALCESKAGTYVLDEPRDLTLEIMQPEALE